MLGHNRSNIEFFPQWLCPYEECKAENDITNPVRCWKCLKLRPTQNQRKRILSAIEKKKKKKETALVDQRQNQMNVKDMEYDESTTVVQTEKTDLEFDLDKLEN